MGLENPIHIVLILLVVLLVFGAKRLPEMGRSLGDGMRGFKEAISGQAPAPTISLSEAPAHDATVAPVPVAVPQPVAAVAQPVAAVAQPQE